MPFQFIVIACIGYLYGLPDTKRPFIVLAASTTTNLLVELLLVFGLDWGIAGSAWGTVIAQVLSAAVMLAIVVPSLRADGLHHLTVVPSVMWAVVKVGAHLVQRTAFLLAALAVATAAASRVGTADLAGHQIAAQLFLFLAIGVDMFKVSGQSLVGHALGAGRPDDARDVVAHLYGWAWRAGLLLTVVTLGLSPVLPHLFSGRSRRRTGRPRSPFSSSLSMQAARRAHLRARRRAHGGQRLPRPALADDARVRGLPPGVRRRDGPAVARHRDRVAGAAALDLRAGGEEPHPRPGRPLARQCRCRGVTTPVNLQARWCE